MRILLLTFTLLLLSPLSVQARSWTEKCPSMEVEKPFTYKRIWQPDNSWSKRPIPSNQPILKSCGNWKVFEQTREMACFYGGYKVTYDYAVKKPIPEGATCQRDTNCQFKCSDATVIRKNVPKYKLPKQLQK